MIQGRLRHEQEVVRTRRAREAADRFIATFSQQATAFESAKRDIRPVRPKRLHAELLDRVLVELEARLLGARIVGEPHVVAGHRLDNELELYPVSRLERVGAHHEEEILERP